LTAAPKRILIAGGTGLLGRRVAAILLDQGASVTMLIRADDSRDTLDGRASSVAGDPWDPASLRGRFRSHDALIHLIGSVRADPRRGLTYKRVNQVALHNVATVAMGDNVPHVLYLSASARPMGVPAAYLESKRDAEQDLKQIGLAWTIIRAPTLYVPGAPRHSLYRVVALMAYLPPMNWLLAAHRPLSLETTAFGLASLALTAQAGQNRLIGPRQLLTLGQALARQQPRPSSAQGIPVQPVPEPDDPPFGWLPPIR